MSTEKRKARRKRKRKIRWVRLVLAACLLAGGLWYVAGDGAFPALPFLKTFDPQRLFALDRSAEASAETVIPGRGLAVAENGKLAFYTGEGEKLWEKAFDLRAPRLFANEAYLILADIETGQVIRLDYGGEVVNRIEKAFPLGGVSQNRENYMVYFSREGNRLDVIDNKGKTITEITIPKGYILDAAISNSNSIIAVSTLSVQSEKYYSSILFYSLDGAVLAGNRYDGEIVFSVGFTREDELKALANDGIFSMSRDGDVRWEQGLDKTLVRAGENPGGYLGLVLEDVSGNAFYKGLTEQGTFTEETPLSESVVEVRVNDQLAAVFMDRSVAVFDRKGRLEGVIPTDFKVLGGGWVDETRLALVYDNRIEILTLYE